MYELLYQRWNPVSSLVFYFSPTIESAGKIIWKWFGIKEAIRHTQRERERDKPHSTAGNIHGHLSTRQAELHHQAYLLLVCVSQIIA